MAIDIPDLVQSLFAGALKDLGVTASVTFKIVAQGYDASAADPDDASTDVETDLVVPEAVLADFTASQVAKSGGSILQTDRLVICPEKSLSGTTLRNKDRVQIGSDRYTIVKITRDPVSAALQVQIRRP